MSVHETQTTGFDLLSPKITGFGLAYSIAVIFNALLMMLKETSPAVRDLMVALTGHHWVTHGVLDLLVFVILGYVFAARGMRWDGNRLSAYVVGSTVLSGLLIVGFFVIIG